MKIKEVILQIINLDYGEDELNLDEYNLNDFLNYDETYRTIKLGYFDDDEKIRLAIVEIVSSLEKDYETIINIYSRNFDINSLSHEPEYTFYDKQGNIISNIIKDEDDWFKTDLNDQNYSPGDIVSFLGDYDDDEIEIEVGIIKDYDIERDVYIVLLGSELRYQVETYEQFLKPYTLPDEIIEEDLNNRLKIGY